MHSGLSAHVSTEAMAESESIKKANNVLLKVIHYC